MLSDGDKTVLRDVARIARDEGLEFFVIGTGARFLVHDWPHAIPGGRGTTDWDIAVRAATWDDYQQLRSALTAGGAPFRSTSVEHRLAHDAGRRLDFVPFGGVESLDRTVTYPKGETSHSVVGLSECEACCVEVDLGDEISVRVVGAPGLTLLKAQAYLDRRPTQTHDVRDLDFMVRTYAEALGDPVVFDRAADVLQDDVVEYEHVGAYLLALDIRELGVGNEAVRSLHALLPELTDEASRAVDDLLVGRGAPQARARRTVVQRYAAFAIGFDPHDSWAP